ncbi:hybrid sensor histidine kinase/response regulator transcription factor [Bacteroides sp. 519]|uniref:hybrid sensor histidine kinase/response regulator transcription factor n=1 Tax=Bacteroides sp. 519 TaxID=2302937 RepID=UPI0013D3ECC5|nr:hybrid sensor histidine kinase/response regulator transcription factor [Bacteroides sp. 519]NDV59508.1 response regulator [Bacteroides sp. 519]
MRQLLLSIFIIISIGLSAQSNPVVQLGIEQGLSNNSIVSITQDRDGFLWFATEEGLNKFDGARFISYYKHTQSISGNELNRIYADPEEPVIWIATQRAGFNAYNYETNSLKVYTHKDDMPNSLVTNDITDIKPSADGNLWISTYHRGVEYFNKKNGEFTHYNTSLLPNLCSDNVWTIMDDHNGKLYIGHVMHGMSILSLKDRRIKHYKHNPNLPGSIPGDDVRCIYKDTNNNIWVGTNRGLALFNEETGTFVMPEKSPNGLISSNIFEILQTDDNKLWIGTELNGIYIIDLKQHYFINPGQLHIQHFTIGHNVYSLSNPTVRSIYQDNFRNMWIGTYGGGINFIGNTPPLFNAHTYSPLIDDLNSLNNRVVLSLCTDEQDRLWIGTDGGGINVFEKGKRVAIFNEEGGQLTHNSVLSAKRDSENNIWLGTFWGGVNFYNSKTKQFKAIPLNGRNNQDVRTFFEDEYKRMWIGTNLGVFVVDIKTQQVIAHYNNEKDNLPEDLVRSINKDNNEQIWIGTFGQGLGIYTADMKPVATLNEHNGFCSNTINYIYKDSEGRMWIGTGEGLACFPNPKSLEYKVYERKDGMQNTFICAITEDENSNIWFSTNAGISSLQTGKGLFLNYNYFDKIPMGSFTMTATNDKKGNIYFGSINGVRYFDPLIVLSNRDVPPATITEMHIYAQQSAPEDSKNINYFNNHKQIELNFKQNTFSINFNVQDYSLANQVDYSYRLKGLDDSWYTVDENNVMFRNILPGKYEFQVKTRIRNQEWSNEISSLFIHITPPLWLTWWAKTLYFIIATTIVFMLLYAYKKKVDLQSSYELEKKNHEQEQELNNERLRFYTNIAHELRTPLTLILGPLEDLQKDTQLMPKQTQKISVVHQSALRLLNLINQILEFRKTETQNKKLCVSKNNIAAIVKEIGFKYKELNRKPEIDLSVEVENDDMPLFFDKEIVNIVLDNLISNAIKYTDRGKIEINLYTTTKQEVSYTEIRVKDTGHGISPDELSQIFNRYYQAKSDKQASGTGIGLALVKNLIAIHEGEIRVESTLNEGSCFCFSLLTYNTYPNALHSEPEKPRPEEVSVDNIENTGNDKPILLVVEDNPDIRDYINDSFCDTFEVYTANEGESGYQAAIAHIPDIIVSDIMMPGMNGIALTKIIKEDVRTSHIPVILLTAKDSLQDKEEGYESGADSYLTKPFSATLLRSRINNLLEGRKKLANQFSSNIKAEDDKSIKFKESLTQLDNDFLQSITKLIEDNLESEKIDIGYLSDKMFMSSSTLYRKIKALTGVSTNEFVRKIKMRNAERLLLEGKFTITEVSFRVGMNSPVYFRQCFKEEFGVTPSEYLRRLKE